MERSQLAYREIAPSPDLEPFILSFWAFEAPQNLSKQIEHEIFPDGCSSLLFWRNLERETHLLGISGLQLETVKTTIVAGDAFWGMRLSPAACSSILQIDPMELLRIKIPKPAKDFPNLTTNLSDQLTFAQEFEQFVSICQRRMRELIARGINYDRVVAESVARIADSPGDIRIDQLAEDLGLSTRQFQRRFKASSGLSPKQYIRARRIRATAVHLVERDGYNLADRAAELGFADQSHMSHEFAVITKRSPNSFAQTVAKIDHGNLVK